jgi:hypothetical protein
VLSQMIQAARHPSSPITTSSPVRSTVLSLQHNHCLLAKHPACSCAGYSAAPDLYLGYGQKNDNRMADPPLYSFEYPADWTEEIPTKTEKSTMVSALLHMRTVLLCVCRVG